LDSINTQNPNVGKEEDSRTFPLQYFLKVWSIIREEMREGGFYSPNLHLAHCINPHILQRV
jgi:hypothetical protein